VIYRTVVRNRKKDPKRLWDAYVRSEAQRRAPHPPDMGGSKKTSDESYTGEDEVSALYSMPVPANFYTEI
jgi:hypothetical protein